MKKIILLLALFVCTSTFGQNYVPFPLELGGATWTKVYFASWCSFEEFCFIEEYIPSGTKTIRNKEYTTFSAYEMNTFHQIEEVHGFLPLRNDIANKRVMIYYKDKEQVLYDFDLSKGDTTITLSYSAVVDSVDSILYDNNYRKRFYLLPLDDGEYSYHPFNIVEGVGSTNGLFHADNEIKDFEPDYHLLICHKVNQSVLYSYEVISDPCQNINTTETNKTALDSGQLIYPTITNNRVFFNTKGQEVPYELYGISGKKLMEGVATFIDVSGLEKGVYFVKIKTNNAPYIQQILVN